MAKKPSKNTARFTPDAERRRIQDRDAGTARWERWGPYLSERQWGTVREDYSADGSAWDYLPHDMARSVAYRWGEDGIAGLSDDQQHLCLSLALWNGKDPILKERLFGLTNSEANHGEDVKEQYYYLDATPTHSYLKMLYKYPHAAYPYADLVEENGRRGFDQPEYEVVDTGVFDEDRYFDVVVEYAKAGVNDIVMQISVTNRGPESAELTVIPQAFFRNTWSWDGTAKRPEMALARRGEVSVKHPALPDMRLHFDDGADPLFTENKTNPRRGWGGDDQGGHFKDAFHAHVVDQDTEAINPDATGTKLGVVHKIAVGPGKTEVVRIRLTDQPLGENGFADVDEVFATRRAEADAFYDDLQKGIPQQDQRNIQRQALAGMIWSKQFFYYDVEQWLKGDPAQPAPPDARKQGRNADWLHLNNAEIISMPDKWEYPWYAAWDLAFHCLPLALVDSAFAKGQLVLMTREWYMHPNGQIPAYEWNFSDVNPPVHAWATWRVFQIDRKQRRQAGDAKDPGDLAFLETVFHKLMINFTWWVNRKDTEGRNVFQGGFLGLDNIGVFDRSAPLPTGGFISQSDGTSWMAMYSLNLMRIALELALHNPVYEDIATKFFEHFLHIAEAMTNLGGEGIGLWDEEDSFYYDVLNMPNGKGGFQRVPMRVRSLVGLIPLFAVETIEPECLKKLPNFARRMDWLLENKPDLANLVSRWEEPGRGERRLLSLMRGSRIKAVLSRMLDEKEFLSPYGIRGVSKAHEADPYVFEFEENRYEVPYTPGESITGLFGGNSNWRGPIWMPVNYLLVESLQKFHHYYGNDFKIDFPVGSDGEATLLEAADELSRRLISIFAIDAEGRRPVLSNAPEIFAGPHYRDHVLFHEYFHGDTGRGIGASHQTGWTGLVAKLIHPRAALVTDKPTAAGASSKKN